MNPLALLALLAVCGGGAAYDAHNFLLRDSFEEECTKGSCQVSSLANWKVFDASSTSPGLVNVTAAYNAFDGSYAVNMNGGAGLNANELHSVPLDFVSGVRYQLSWAMTALFPAAGCDAPRSATVSAGVTFDGWASSVPFSFGGPYDPAAANVTWTTMSWRLDASTHFSGPGTIVITAPMDRTAECGILIDAIEMVALGAVTYQ